MNNADMPASPTNLYISEYEGTINCPYNKPLTGMTKREAFAMAAMQGLISNHQLRGAASECAISAVDYADALLKELDKDAS